MKRHRCCQLLTRFRCRQVGAIGPTGLGDERRDGPVETVAALKILYLLTTPPPVLPGTDAVAQEVDLLRSRFGGEAIYLRPSWRARAWYPSRFLGLDRLRAIRRRDTYADLHHVYASQLFTLPLLRLIRRPIVYTVTSGVGSTHRVPSLSYLRRLGAIVVPGRSDLDALTRLGLENVHVVPPGIDVSRFIDTPPPSGSEFILLAGSAPWARQQFVTKGIDALLALARDMRDVRLVFLWRGVLLREVIARVMDAGLAERVEILQDRVDVSRVLIRAHASVVLAEAPGLVKAYPHSLLEALAAGRPVVISDGIRWPNTSGLRSAGVSCTGWTRRAGRSHPGAAAELRRIPGSRRGGRESGTSRRSNSSPHTAICIAGSLDEVVLSVRQ